MSKARGQAALEFLMTYGWAILVVLVVIGTLAYFGVLNPSVLLPEKCTLQMGFYCKDHQINQDNSEVSLRLENGMGKGIIVTRLKVGDITESLYCDAGVGNYTGTMPVLGCNETDCSACTGGSDSFYACNPNQNFGNTFNNAIGWRIANGDHDDITVKCTHMTQSEGKVKVDINMVYFFEESGEKFSHTMSGELLAKIESIQI